MEQNVAYLEQSLKGPKGPVEWNSYSNHHLLNLSMLARLRWIDSLASNEVAAAANEKTQYNRLMSLQLEILERLRLSPRIGEQNEADRIAVSLLNELQQEGSLKLVNQANRQAAFQVLSDRQGRLEARKKAIALSWREYRRDLERGMQVNLGGFTLDNDRDESRKLPFGLYIEELKIRNRGDLLTDYLWRITTSPPETITFEDRQQLQTSRDTRQIAIPKSLDNATISELNAAIHRDLIPPLYLWNGKWELIAEDFARRS